MNISFKDWQIECIEVAARLGLPQADDMWGEGDPRDLEQDAAAAYSNGESPITFVKEMFAEDLAEAGYAESVESMNSMRSEFYEDPIDFDDDSAEEDHPYYDRDE